MSDPSLKVQTSGQTFNIRVFLLFTAILLLAGACTSTLPGPGPGTAGPLATSGEMRPQQIPEDQSQVTQIETAEHQAGGGAGDGEDSVNPAKSPDPRFDKETLYQLLVAEVAGYRGDHDMALRKYAQVAVAGRDPGVAARATRLAAYLKRDDMALKTAMIWTEEEPDSVEAHRYMADLSLKAGDLDDAIREMEIIKDLGGLANFEVFAYRASGLERSQQLALLQAISRLLDKYPNDNQLKFSKAILLEKTGKLEEALNLSNELLLSDNNLNVIILKVNTLKELGRNQQAVDFLQEKVSILPDNRRLRLIYARILFEVRRLDLAKEQYLWALNETPSDGDILFALALISMEQNNNEDSIHYLNRMIRWNNRVGEAHYYLGVIAERKGDIVTALREYRQAGYGYEFVQAQSRIAYILATQGRMLEARDHLATMRTERPGLSDQLLLVEAQILSDQGLDQELFEFLDQVLVEKPDHIDFLYFRAMSGERFGDLGLLERDLRRIIELQPDNADAMNALGYTLADRTERHQEALELISKALEIKPNEAAFIDSLGWVQYRMNNYDEALIHLKKALDMFPNDEVAAHLGEVLWVVGEKRKARAVWKRGLEMKPDSIMLRNVMERLID